MSVLVTGAAGFVGSHVVDRLLAGGTDVVGLDNFDDFYPEDVKRRNIRQARDSSGFHLVEGDIRDPEALESLPDAVDAVIHLAARAGVRPSIAHPQLYTEVNVGGTMQLLELAARRGLRTFVFASSSSVYGNNEKVPFSEDDPVDHPISPYAATKRAAELLAHAHHHLHGMTLLCLRLFTVYGPRQRPDLAIHAFARRLRDGRPIPRFGDGSTARDYTYIDDIVDGVEAALHLAREADPRFEIVNLGESRTVSLSEMIDTLSQEMGVSAEIQELPLQPGDVTVTYADVSKARRLLGYEPRTGFRHGVRRFLEWFESTA